MFKTLQGCRLTTPIWNTALLCSSLEAPWTRLSSYLPTDGEPTSDDHHITLLCADRGPQGLDASVCTLSRSLPQCLLKQNPSCISRQLQATSRRRITVNGREGDSSPQRRCTVSPGIRDPFLPDFDARHGLPSFCAQAFVESGQMRLNVTQGRGV